MHPDGGGPLFFGARLRTRQRLWQISQKLYEPGLNHVLITTNFARQSNVC